MCPERLTAFGAGVHMGEAGAEGTAVVVEKDRNSLWQASRAVHDGEEVSAATGRWQWADKVHVH